MILMKSFKVKELIKQADQFRDTGNFSEAIRLYREILQISPNHFGVMMQLGNCLKELGHYDEALAMYKGALVLRPKNADTYLQQGHLLKKMGQPLDALFSYQSAHALDPSNAHSIKEIKSLGGSVSVTSVMNLGKEATHTIWLDFKDVMEYAAVNVSLSGIQRVVLNLLAYAREFNNPGYRVVPVLPEYDRGRIFAVSPEMVLALAQLYDAPRVERHLLDAALQEIYAARIEVTPKKDDVIVVAGAFWINQHYDSILALRERGVRFSLFVHDLIQIRNPEYVMPDAFERFQTQWIEGLYAADFILTNSKYVENDVRNYVETHLNFSLPVQAIPLATELRGISEGGNYTSENSEIKFLVSNDYVLCVSTLEIRKNHMFLIKIWEKLRQNYGDKVPALVLVGKWGWQIDEFRDYIDQKGYVGDWLFVYNGISDQELEFLYRNSIFTVYPSFAEGFGLPIGESLVYGKPCVASETTSMPEVGGDFVRYIDPFDVEKSFPVFEYAINNRDDLCKWEENIKKNFKVKRWNSFCSEFFDAIVYNNETLKERMSRRPLPSEEIVTGGHHDVLEMAHDGGKIITFWAARHANWHPMEAWGVWSKMRRATLVFDSDFPAGTDVNVYLRVRCPPANKNVTLVADAGKSQQAIRISEHDQFYGFSGVVQNDGRIKIDLLLRGQVRMPANHSIYIGLTGISYCSSLDATSLTRMAQKLVPVAQPTA